MADTRRPPKKKTLEERARDLVQGILEALDSLLPEPEPQFIPIPIRKR